MARAVVLEHASQKIAIVSVDLVGLFLPVVDKVRKELPGMTYVLVSSTHNHEGPGYHRHVGAELLSDRASIPHYLKKVEAGIVQAVSKADQALRPMTARIGKALAPELLHDGREPYVKHDELVALQFQDPASTKHARRARAMELPSGDAQQQEHARSAPTSWPARSLICRIATSVPSSI